MHHSIGALRLKTMPCDSALVVRASGLATAGNLNEAVRLLRPALSASALTCFDYTRTAMAVMLSGADDGLPGSLTRAAVWLLPTEEDAQLWRRQAVRFALAGLRRYATSDPREALRWMIRQAQADGHPMSMQQAAQIWRAIQGPRTSHTRARIPESL